MLELYPWCLSCPYTLDIHKNMREREISGRRIRFQSPQLHYRGKMVNWIKSVSERMKLSIVTVHLGVHLLDKFMDNHNITASRLAPIALICLEIAAKFEEQDSRILKLCDLLALLQSAITITELVSLENFILQSFSWRVLWPTVAHFAEFYSMLSVVKGDQGPVRKTTDQLEDLIKGTMRDLVDIVLSEPLMLRFLSSEIAAACLLAARIDHCVKPAWPSAIADITGYSRSSLEPCLNHILDIDSVGNNRKRKLSDESGYETSSSPESNIPAKRRRL